MDHISNLLEDVMIDDKPEIDYDDDIQQYYIAEVFKKKNIPLSTIVKWECQLARIIYKLHLKRVYISSIDLNELMVNENLDIIADTTMFYPWKGHGVTEVVTIDSIIRMHKSIHEYIMKSYMSNELSNRINALYKLSNFYYMACIRCNSVTSVHDLITSMNILYRMVDVGLIDDINKYYNTNNKA